MRVYVQHTVLPHPPGAAAQALWAAPLRAYLAVLRGWTYAANTIVTKRPHSNKGTSAEHVSALLRVVPSIVFHCDQSYRKGRGSDGVRLRARGANELRRRFDATVVRNTEVTCAHLGRISWAVLTFSTYQETSPLIDKLHVTLMMDVDG